MARDPDPAASPPTLTSVRIRPRPDPLLIICRCFSFLTAVIALLCVAVNVLSAVTSFRNGNDIFGGIFRCYAVAFALFVAVAETEWSFIMKFWRILDYWAGRGMLQIFVAVMTRAFPDVSGQRQDLVLLQEIASYLLAACGFTYVISGVLCIGFLKRARQHKEITREQAAKDLERGQKRGINRKWLNHGTGKAQRGTSISVSCRKGLRAQAQRLHGLNLPNVR